MFPVLAIPSAERFINGRPMTRIEPPHVVYQPRPKSTMGRTWQGQNRVMSDDLSFTDPSYPDDSSAYSTGSVDLTGDNSSVDPNVTTLINNVAGVATNAAIGLAQKALGINQAPVYPSNYPVSYPPSSTLPKWLIPAAVGGVILLVVMGGKKKAS